MVIVLVILALLGFAVCLYAYVTEERLKINPNYKAACDISEMVSCTKPMKSAYASLFYVSNAVVGVLFYLVIAILAFIDQINLVFFAVSLSCIATLFLAYILYFKIRSLCLICTSTYIINISMFLYTFHLLYTRG
jgi:vitamin-K-epoxide reductase (warfarin-sensitive)